MQFGTCLYWLITEERTNLLWYTLLFQILAAEALVPLLQNMPHTQMELRVREEDGSETHRQHYRSCWGGWAAGGHSRGLLGWLCGSAWCIQQIRLGCFTDGVRQRVRGVRKFSQIQIRLRKPSWFQGLFVSSTIWCFFTFTNLMLRLCYRQEQLPFFPPLLLAVLAAFRGTAYYATARIPC